MVGLRRKEEGVVRTGKQNRLSKGIRVKGREKPLFGFLLFLVWAVLLGYQEAERCDPTSWEWECS